MPTRKFPGKGFVLNKSGKGSGDQDLLVYLQRSSSFSFLSGRTRKKVKRLKLKTDQELCELQPDLLKLWPDVLTDALKKLKRRDPREYRIEKHATFFDNSSLGVTELANVLKGFSEFEGMLYGASPERYRDHLVHSFRVWIIGQGILKKNFMGMLNSGLKLKSRISQEEWECMWAIVALCHDIGYPLSHIGKINQKAREALLRQGLLPEGDLRFSFSQQMRPFHDTIIKMMASKPIKMAEVTQDEEGRQWLSVGHLGNKYAFPSDLFVSLPVGNGNEKKVREYVTHLRNKYYLKLIKSFNELDHGIVSALLTSKALVYFLESDYCHDDWSLLTEEDARQFVIRREMLRAMADHTCPDIYHLRFNTLSFLLYLADEIQCWGRPTFKALQFDTTNGKEEWVHVKELEENKVIITITLPGSWDKNKKDGIKIWLGRLKRMLRLAVGTSYMWMPETYLLFEAQNSLKGKQYQRYYIELKNGRLSGPVYRKTRR